MKLDKERKAAIEEALKHPKDFEKTLKLLGYGVYRRKLIKDLCSMLFKKARE